jgi:hypothetical protein
MYVLQDTKTRRYYKTLIKIGKKKTPAFVSKKKEARVYEDKKQAYFARKAIQKHKDIEMEVVLDSPKQASKKDPTKKKEIPRKKGYAIQEKKSKKFYRTYKNKEGKLAFSYVTTLDKAHIFQKKATASQKIKSLQKKKESELQIIKIEEAKEAKKTPSKKSTTKTKKQSSRKEKIQVILQKSPRMAKKGMVTIGKKKIHFGSSSAEDYVDNHDESKKKQYLQLRKNKDFNDINSPHFWSRWLLWNKKTLAKSIRDIEKKYGIKITWI